MIKYKFTIYWDMFAVIKAYINPQSFGWCALFLKLKKMHLEREKTHVNKMCNALLKRCVLLNVFTRSVSSLWYFSYVKIHLAYDKQAGILVLHSVRFHQHHALGHHIVAVAFCIVHICCILLAPCAPCSRRITVLRLHGLATLKKGRHCEQLYKKKQTGNVKGK